MTEACVRSVLSRHATLVATSTLLLSSLSITSVAQATASTRELYGRERQKTRDAAKQKDDKALREALLALHRDFPGRSSVPEELAQVEARLGNDAAAIDWLKQAVEMGLTPNLDDASFASLKKAPGFAEVAKRAEENRKPVSESSSVFRFGSSDLLTEDLTYDPKTDRFLVSSVRQRKIVSCDRTGKCDDFIVATDSAPTPLWGVFALHLDPDGRHLWATTASLPFESGHKKEDDGKCALLRIDLQSRKIVNRFECESSAKHEMGDMTVASYGDVFVADGASGDVLVLHKGGDHLQPLVAAGTFVAPQTPTLSTDEKFLYVPDYVVGIAAVRLSDGHVEWLTSKRRAALDGIDGLYAKGDRLMGIQNGTGPERIASFRLSGPLEVESWQVLEANWPDLGDPTHGVFIGDDFYFIANSGWDRTGRDGSMAEGKPAEIRKMKLPGR